MMCHLIFVCKYRKKLLSKVGHEIESGKNIVSTFLNIFGRNELSRVMDISHVALEMLAKRLFNSTFKHKVVRAYIP